MDDIISKLCGTVWLAGLEQDDFVESSEELAGADLKPRDNRRRLR